MSNAKGWNDNLNLIIYFSIVLCAIGITWLALNDVPAGIRYITIFLASVALLVISFLFINETQQETAKSLIRNPFTVDYDVASGMYLLGWIVPILLSLILSLFNFGFNISQLMVPLSATDINVNIAQSFTIAQAQADPFWQWFITVFTAGTIEEWTFGFVLMLVGVLIGMLLWRLWKGDDGTARTPGAKNFYLITGLIFTALIFAGAHKLNASYVGYMFLVATLFRLGMNWGIYYWGVFLSFTMGYHQSNNAIWFWTEYGPTVTLKAISSMGGIVIITFLGLIVFLVLRRIDIVAKKIRSHFQNSGGV